MEVRYRTFASAGYPSQTPPLTRAGSHSLAACPCSHSRLLLTCADSDGLPHHEAGEHFAQGMLPLPSILALRQQVRHHQRSFLIAYIRRIQLAAKLRP